MKSIVCPAKRLIPTKSSIIRKREIRQPRKILKHRLRACGFCVGSCDLVIAVVVQQQNDPRIHTKEKQTESGLNRFPARSESTTEDNRKLKINTVHSSSSTAL